jgi:ABC-type transport system involved in cytochrome bd biosynthesis fused ATPase/permease subunit
MTGGMGGGMGGGWGYGSGSGSGSGSSDQRQGLSGGEWQRIALARAFMRANEPEVDLLVFDEPVSLDSIPGPDSLAFPHFLHFAFALIIFRIFVRILSDPSAPKQTSSLDAHAQNQIFETIAKISKTPSGDKRKTVVYITHRLSTARRADKVAMMDNGVSSLSDRSFIEHWR